MEETVLFPSPNWFQFSTLVVSKDNWLVYGGPNKSLCVLEPLPADCKRVIQGDQGYNSHVVNRAHPEKIVSLDLCPEWPEKKAVLAGSQDGLVKQWVLEQGDRCMAIGSTHSHDTHHHNKEEVAGVGYCKDNYAVTVGSHCHIVKWDLQSNVLKSYTNYKVFKGFKPTCIACSPHINLNVAIGTKQGVIFVVDLNGQFRVVYKVRGQDDELTKLSWCPQYEVVVKKMLKEHNETKKPPKSAVSKRLEDIRLEPVDTEVLEALDKRVQESDTEEQPMLINDRLEPLKSDVEAKTDEVASGTKAETNNQTNAKETLNESGITKTLPEDSFEETVVQEDDMFDIYQDHEIEEFGHKKYEIHDELVKVKEDTKQDDYLAECLKLKEEILKRKNESEQSMNTLVDAMDKTHVSSQEASNHPSSSQCEASSSSQVEIASASHCQNSNEAVSSPIQADGASGMDLRPNEGRIIKGEFASSVHIHKHLLATIGKHGSVRVWSKSGKMVASCVVLGPAKTNSNQRSNTNWTTLLWQQPEVLLLADSRSQLLNCNPLVIDSTNKLKWKLVHSIHKRDIFVIASNAPNVQTIDMPSEARDKWLVWTTSQERLIVCYSLKQKQVIQEMHTCGGHPYTVKPCPYDARKIAISVGDGAVRVWESETTDDETKLKRGEISTYWQNVQGKVLTVAWHPTKENLLAFATAESRVGLINTGSAKTEKPAKTLPPALTTSIYSLSWGEGSDLYVCGSGGDLVRYNCDHTDKAPTIIPVTFEGQKWSMSSVQWFQQGLVCGSDHGGVAILDANNEIVTAVFVFSKMIHNVDWHPQETSNSDSVSPYSNLLAVCSLDKSNNVVILEYGVTAEQVKQLSTYKVLSGHKGAVVEVAWNPHVDGQLLSVSQDSTIMVWSVIDGSCLAIFAGHSQSALAAAWSPFPQLPTTIVSGGGDCCLRLWDYTDHPPELYEEPKLEGAGKKDKKRNKKAGSGKKKAEEGEECDEDEHTGDTTAALVDAKTRTSKRFLLPHTAKQTSPCRIEAVRAMFASYCKKHSLPDPTEWRQDSTEVAFIKLFGSSKELGELLDGEAERHQDTGALESYMMLQIVRGYMEAAYSYAADKDLLDPFLLSIAPCVSFKYWKDVTMLYVAQITRMVAKGQEEKLSETKLYGGPIYRKVGALLSLHDVTGAVKVLVEAQLFLEAYVLCRTRYVEDLTEVVLKEWAEFCYNIGSFNLAALCYIAQGDPIKAANVLSRSNDEDAVYTAATMAKVLGQTAFSKHCFEKYESKVSSQRKEQAAGEEANENLKVLPSRSELVLQGDKKDIELDGTHTEAVNDDLSANGDSQVVEENTDPDLQGKNKAIVEDGSNAEAVKIDSPHVNVEGQVGNDNKVSEMEKAKVHPCKLDIADEAITEKRVIGQASAIEGNKPSIDGQESAIEGNKPSVGGQESAIEGNKSSVGNNIPSQDSANEGNKPSVDYQKSAIKGNTSSVDGQGNAKKDYKLQTNGDSLKANIEATTDSLEQVISTMAGLMNENGHMVLKERKVLDGSGDAQMNEAQNVELSNDNP